jgi:hypothetical protein
LTRREDDIYIKLLQEEHELIKADKMMSNELKAAMEQESNMFNIFSQRLRDAHQASEIPYL